MQLLRSAFRMVVPVAVAGVVAACDEGPTGPESAGTPMAIEFATLAAEQAGASSAMSGTAVVQSHGGASLVIEGSNGVLEIHDLRVIVEDFELERAEDECDDVSGGDDDACEKFEVPPYFLDLPLAAGTTVTAVEQPVPADRYEELELEIDDLDTDDEDDPEETQQALELLRQIREEFGFPEWPEDGSLVVVGTFTPTGGEPAAFEAYFEAEVEVELEFDPPLTLTDEGTGATATVTIDPGTWFSAPDGTVIDLSQYDFDTTGRVERFEVELEDGWELEWED